MISTHSVWIGPKLGLMEKLTLNLLVKHGHDATLWTQGKVEGVPKGVEVKPLPKDILKPIGFAGNPHAYIPNGGIGSFAHWSDYFALETLYRHGGTWVQMDCAVNCKLDLADYTFSPWLSSVSPVVMTIPKGSEYAADVGVILCEMLGDGMAGRDWHEAMLAIHQGLQRHGIEYSTLPNYFDCGGVPVSPYTHPIKADIIHWSNATHNTSKEKPTKGSEYERLCKECGLLTQSPKCELA
jgi:hypothetical protein